MIRRIDPGLYSRVSAGPDSDLSLRYLGTAGFELVAGQHTVVVDPFVTRPGPWTTLFGRMAPDAARIRRVLPRADEVLVGHAHYDHVLDAPVLCQQTGARLIGSPSVCHVGRAAGLPETQMVQTMGGEDIPVASGHVRGLKSQHGRVYFGRVTLPGKISAPPPWPPRLRALRHGQVLNWYMELGGVRVMHVDSADFDNERFAEHQVDVLCLCAIGRAYRPGYTQDAIRLLRPKVVVACHWDLFITPYEAPPLLLPGVDLPGFVAEIEAAGAAAVVLPFDGSLGVQRGSTR